MGRSFLPLELRPSRLRIGLLRWRGHLKDLTQRVRRLTLADLRWSFLWSATLVVMGVVVNACFANGWTIWPLVGVAGVLLMVNEAADRNGEGLPPMQVYALFFAAIGAYIAVLAMISAVNVLVLIAGVGTCGYYVARAVLQQRFRDQLTVSRLNAGQCIHCGTKIDSGFAFCYTCGEEPNPAAGRQARLANVIGSGQRTARLRAMLSRPSSTAHTRVKEQALLARRANRRTRKR